MTAPKTARFAERYCEIGMALTWTPYRQKGPRHPGWNLPENAITDPAAARHRWTERPMDGVAVLLGASGLVGVDVDDETSAPTVMRDRGINLKDLRDSAPCIVGRHYRLMYRAPDVALKHRTLTWPKQDDPRASSVLFEFRAGAIADTLPPSVHPGTGLPYRWENPPARGFPPLPQRLLEMWLDWTETQRRALALCPWAPPPDPPAPLQARRESRGASVIDAFNQAHDAEKILEEHGYIRRGKRRFTSPDSQHAAGIVLTESGKVFCHHAGDRLASEHALDAFDLYRVLEHGGDYRAAVHAAAKALGMDQDRNRERAA
jgi:putative DNA primase/helicase